MTPTQARAFLAVAASGGFTEAARALRVSQPTLSSQIQEIEKQYDVELFRRSGRGVSLTPAGQALLPHIRKMFAGFEDARALLEDMKGRRRGLLRVGSYGPYDVISLLARYKSQSPGVALAVEFHNSEVLAQKLLDGELDVAVLGRIRRQRQFFTLPLSRPPLILIAPRTPKWIGHAPVTPGDLRGETIIRREAGSTVRASFDRFLATSRIAQGRAHEFGGREGVINAVAENLGVGAIFDEGLIPEQRIVKLEIAGAPICSTVDVICLANRKSRPLLANFLAIAEQFSKERDSRPNTERAAVSPSQNRRRGRSKTGDRPRPASPRETPPR